MGTIEPVNEERYRLKWWAFLPQLLFFLLLLVVFLSLMVSPDWWGSGGAGTKSAKTLAPVMFVGSLFGVVQFLAMRLRGPVRVDSEGVFNPFEGRKDRRVAWSEVSGIRDRRDGKSLELTTARGRSSVIMLDMMREPSRLEQDILARLHRHPGGQEPPDEAP